MIAYHSILNKVVKENVMQLDSTDYKIILDALYNLELNDSADLSDDVSALSDNELEQRLLMLRAHFSRLERKSNFED